MLRTRVGSIWRQLLQHCSPTCIDVRSLLNGPLRSTTLRNRTTGLRVGRAKLCGGSTHHHYTHGNNNNANTRGHHPLCYNSFVPRHDSAVHGLACEYTCMSVVIDGFFGSPPRCDIESKPWVRRTPEAAGVVPRTPTHPPTHPPSPYNHGVFDAGVRSAMCCKHLGDTAPSPRLFSCMWVVLRMHMLQTGLPWASCGFKTLTMRHLCGDTSPPPPTMCTSALWLSA